MILWPWQSLKKELEKRLEKSDFEVSKTYSPEEFFNELKKSKPKRFYVVWYYSFKYKMNDICWGVYRFFRPCNQKIRNSIPRRWMDLTELIRTINFQIIVQFYEEEYSDSMVGFDAEFCEWIEKSYLYITKDREDLCIKIDEELTRAFELPYANGNYNLANNMEADMEAKDSVILEELIKYRKYFWT